MFPVIIDKYLICITLNEWDSTCKMEDESEVAPVFN
jgi:hypothetical protein